MGRDQSAAQNQLAENDSTEYELIILDPGFDSWFVTRNFKATARSETYYKHWNQFYVSEWNRLFYQGHPYFENSIDYDYTEDYGFDLNYKLYHYFLYTEEVTGIKLVNRAR